jgi:hypothetical protein
MHIHLEHIDNSEEKVESCGHEKAWYTNGWSRCHGYSF